MSSGLEGEALANAESYRAIMAASKDAGGDAGKLSYDLQQYGDQESSYINSMTP